MGCSSSRPAAKEKNPNLKTGIPKKRPADMENGLDVDGGEANNVKDLILKRSQQSMEGRANQTLVHNLVHDEFRRQITEVYDMAGGKLLGKGGFGTVQTVTHKQSRVKYALKAVELSRVKDEKSLDFFFREVEVMRSLDHPNICRLHAVYPTVDYLFMVMDLCEGGDLLTTYHFKSEQEAANIVLKVTSAVRYMHDRHIAHRDLKLDNILTDYTKDGTDVKVVDFGLSAHFEDFRLEHDIVGTWVYMAPEVISGSHFPRTCDMWSIGVISYLLLCGYPPFGGSSTAELKEQIQHGTYQFHYDAWSSISNTAKNFIKRLLVRNPQERMSAAEAQHHPWLNMSSLEKEGICDDAIENMKKFRQTNYLKKLALELVARSLDTEQIRQLEQCFVAMDKDGSGTISFEEFESVLSTHENLSAAEIKGMFEAANVDNGKELHFNDFLAATLGRRDLDERRLTLAFDRLDFDHSGKIDASDLKLIVGGDLEEEDVMSLMDEFDLNKDGSIDFEEFQLAMRKVDAPGAEFPVVRLATARASSMPNLELAAHLDHIQETLVLHQLPNGKRMTDGTPSSSFDETDTSVHDRRQIVSRASLVRCVSRLVDQTGNRQRRRTTIGISNPAAKVAVAKAAMQAEALKTGRKLAGSDTAGPDPLADFPGSSDSTQTSTATKFTAIDSVHPLAEEFEEPMPWGRHVSRAEEGSSLLTPPLQ